MPALRTAALGLLLAVAAAQADDTASNHPLKETPGAGDARAAASLANAPKIESIVTLPIMGLRAVVSNGELLYMSDTGRFIFRGVMYDAWNRKALNTLDEMRESIDHIDLALMGIKVEDFHPLRLGSGKEHVTVFVDPKCPWCKKLMAQVEAADDIKSRYTIDLVAIPVLGEASQKLVRELGCAKNRHAALRHLVTEDYSKPLEPTKDCDLVPIQKSMVAAQILGVTGVPFLIHADGRVQRGLPKDLGGWLSAKPVEQQKPPVGG